MANKIPKSTKNMSIILQCACAAFCGESTAVARTLYMRSRMKERESKQETRRKQTTVRSTVVVQSCVGKSIRQEKKKVHEREQKNENANAKC